MPPSFRHDVALIGGGIVGLATARALVRAGVERLIVLEAEQRVGAHQTGHNSGVIHSGIYYRPGSLKARTCAEGRRELIDFCERHDVPHEICGKLIVAVTPREAIRLEALERRGRVNGLEGLELLDETELRRREPHARGVQALHVPQAGIVDFGAVAEALKRSIERAGAVVCTGARVVAVRRDTVGFVLHTTVGEVSASRLINCGGLQSDRIARLCGVEPGLAIVPFRGEYFRLAPERERLIRNLVYPVPDPDLPFLGAHFTRMIRGGVEAGPNAVFALKREGYHRLSFSARDTAESLGYVGFRRLARKHWRMGVVELGRSASRRAFAAALRRLVPDLRPADLVRHGAGIRAQAVAPDGSLLDDFRIREGSGMLHVLNAPSPGATASLAIGRSLAERAVSSFGLGRTAGLADRRSGTR
jgi:L-2-hydroxyglutarate oxidase